MIRIINKLSGEKIEMEDQFISRLYTLLLFYHEKDIPFVVSFSPKSRDQGQLC